MFFKRIEMVGFKSFATRTVCDFIPGTTVVVGPNGCGKSNILDAIKWVVGEQTASQLRGKKMQDVIFSGSASFKPLGVAQVTLTIDNSTRILPSDYEEIQITRRLFRSGESEYLLNKTPCRLRDIHNLFLGTGIGKSSYSMLEQGRVGQIIGAKPIERRFLIEEAAGISKYRARKLEALRKLERTDVDLSRLTDLISEVDRQVASLKRQANKAERYKGLFDELRRAEQELLVLRSASVRTQLKSLNETLERQRDQLTRLRTAFAEKAAAEEQAREQEEELNERLTDENQALFDLKARLTECDHQITRLNDQIGAHARRKEQIQEEFRELDGRAAEVALRVEEAEQLAADSEQRRAEFSARYDELNREYQELQASATTRTERLEALSSQVNLLREEVSRADNEIRMAEALIARQNETREETESLLRALESSFADLAARREELAAQVEALQTQSESLQQSIEQRRTEQTQRQQRLAALIKELEETHKRLHTGRSRLETLHEMRASYEGYYQGVREVMLAADAGRLGGILGVAPNLIRARGEHELAIEVALATHLQDIVTRTAEDGKQAIEYLKSAGRGRATFLPLDRLQATPLAANLRQILGRKGVVGLASELVDFDREIDVAVQFLLGTTIVVEDLDVGLDLGRQGFRGRYVSLDGQLINPAGSMTGGRIQATGLMSREREMRDLQAEVDRLDQRQHQLRGEIERVQIEMSTAHSQLEADQARLDALRLEHAGLRKDLEAAQRGRDDAERALAERRAQIERIDEEVASRRQAIDQWRARAGEARAQFAAAEAELNQTREEARGQSGHIMELGVQMAEAKAQVDKAHSQLAEAQRQLQTLERDLESVSRQRQARLAEIQELQQQDARLHEQIERIRAELQQTSVEYDEMARQLNADQASREALQLRIKELSAEVERISRDERDLDNQYREDELRHAELQTTLNGLSEQCEEKFERSLESLAEEVGEVEKDAHGLHALVTELRAKIERIGPVNMAALDEYNEQSQRLEFLRAQHHDLTEARDQLRATIERLDETTRKLFHETFEAVRVHFIEMFRRLFNGGKADLILEAPEGLDPLLDGGIEILAQPPGKKLQNIQLMSGGEKALTAIALLFALFLHKPSPFCILDEIDAPLDDINVERFKTVLREFNEKTQFVIITHNKLTMELADALYGVTMEESGVSKLVSVRFEQAEQMVDVG